MTGEAQRILDEVALLEVIQTDLAKIATREDAARRKDLIDLRRTLTAQVGAVGALADPFFGALQDAEMKAAYRTKFSRMRSATAMHQANWSAVRLGEAVEQHRASALTVREANADFIVWVRSAIAQIDRSGPP